ncbi:hypothetical protein ACOME3_002931 [Neoechinorhynchus agilis]
MGQYHVEDRHKMFYIKESELDKIELKDVHTNELKKDISLAYIDPWSPEGGLVDSFGRINWACPCLGSAMQGPCAKYFRDAFLCFHKSSDDLPGPRTLQNSRGADCLFEFAAITECMREFEPKNQESNKEDEIA